MSNRALADEILQLGFGIAASRGIGNKASLLDKASGAGLPVPRGFIITDEALNRLIASGSAIKSSTSISLSKESELISLAGFKQLRPPFAVRSAFSTEDTTHRSLAGFFRSRLFVMPNQLDDALSDVWSSALNYEGSFRHDVLLMEMVTAKHSGVAFTQDEYLDDLINYTTGTADRLVAGEVEGESLLLPKAGTSLPESHKLTGRLQFAERLRRLLHRIRKVFECGNWDIEWADDGSRCWLIQIRPITVAPRRNEMFTIANHKEILPELPSRFMSSMIESCAEGLFAYYRSFDVSLPDKRPFIEVFKGRPLINLSLLSEMMRNFGLPTRLVTANIGGYAAEEFPPDINRMILKSPVLLKLLVAQAKSVSDAEATIAEIQAFTKLPGDTIEQCIETLRRLYKSLVTAMFSLTQSMGWPLMLLRRAGVLEEHNSRQTTISTQMFKDLESLQVLVLERPDLKTQLDQGHIPTDSDFQNLWQIFLATHGHRGIFESDIARPRFREDPSSILAALTAPLRRSKAKRHRSLAGFLTSPLWWQVSRSIKARERLRYFAMSGMERIRNNLLELAGSTLADPAQLWELDISEAKQLDNGWQPDIEFFQLRTQHTAQLESYRLPDLIHRIDDLEQFSTNQTAASDAKTLHGVSLTSGNVTGRALVLNDPSKINCACLADENTILVARSVDAGWIPVFARVAAVVVEIGGDLSHGSIILREIGLPAITNVRNATNTIHTGDQVTLKAGSGIVELS